MSAFADILDVIIGRAGKLREAGVLRVNIDGMAFDLAPIEAAAAADGEEIEEETDEPDPFNDPATYGGRVPGHRRREHEEH